MKFVVYEDDGSVKYEGQVQACTRTALVNGPDIVEVRGYNDPLAVSFAAAKAANYVVSMTKASCPCGQYGAHKWVPACSRIMVGKSPGPTVKVCPVCLSSPCTPACDDDSVSDDQVHVSWNEGKVGFFSGGESYEKFKALFDEAKLTELFLTLGHPKVMVYGEAYGGKQQGMSATYGKDLKFIAFDVQVGDTWLSVPDADDVVQKLGLEFVPYVQTTTGLDTLDAIRDLPSRVAVRRGITEPKPAEGVVLRPLQEFTDSRGSRVIVKHKRADFSERASKKDTVVDPGKMEILVKADAIAFEWVTPTRLQHVLDKLRAGLGRDLEMKDTPVVIAAMVEDVVREATGEIVDSKEARKAIGARAAKLFKTAMQVVKEG